jgi:amino-acid N-acetyltransferase
MTAVTPSPASAAAGAVVVRHARVTDMPRVQKIINYFADRDEMLHRSLNELYEHVRDFIVAEVDGEVQACAAVQVTWDDLAELKCVAVAPEAHGRGLGRLVIDRCLDEASDLGLRRVFALTYKPEFFAKFGFEVIDRTMLPHKVWGECIKCHKFPNCNEIAMMHFIGRGRPSDS